ncbi:MAG: tetratricopeptide repeat protein [Spirochaetales bacterium]|nr:MAG: tetratricopeptide repeat protein [Spirochaetales bacterium]
MGLVIAIIILGIVIAVVAFFLIRSIVAPKRVEAIHNLLKQQKTQAVIKAAKHLITKDSRNADAHYLLGQAYDAEGKQELALMEYRTVNQIGHFGGLVVEVPFRQKIAELYAKFNQPEEALKEYLLLLKKDPGNGDYFFNVGRIFEERSRSDKALQYYKRATELSPRNATARTRLGLLLYRGKHTAEARNQLDVAVRVNPENYEAWYYIGKILKDTHDCMSALSAFEKATRAPEFKVKALIERGGCLITMGSTERAVTELERAVNIAEEGSGESLYAHYFLAHCFEKTRRIELALGEWEHIYKIRPNFRDVAEKLSKYEDLRTDDRVKDFLTVSQADFVGICNRITEVMELTIRDSTEITNGVDIVAVEPTSKWRNARAMPKLIRFLRSPDIVGESTVRETHEEMKKQSITRGLIVASSGFSRRATDYAESRPIDLYSKDKLQSLLQQIEM